MTHGRPRNFSASRIKALTFCQIGNLALKLLALVREVNFFRRIFRTEGINPWIWKSSPSDRDWETVSASQRSTASVTNGQCFRSGKAITSKSSRTCLLGGTNVNTFSISTALALMALRRRAWKPSSGVGVGSMLAAAASSVSTTDAGAFSWRVKG